MHVALDARIAHYNASGLRRYYSGLHATLLDELPSNTRLTTLRSWRQKASSIRGVSRSLYTPPHHYLEPYVLDWELKRVRPDILHCIDFFAPVSQVPQILTAHDLYFLQDPTCLDSASLRHYRQFLDYVPNAQHIVCISKATRDDVLRLSSATKEKVSVIYPGFTALVSDAHSSEASRLRGRLGFSGPIVLSVGTIEPRKNYRRSVQAYLQARSVLGDALPPLVIVGRPGYRGDEILRDFENAPGRVLYLGEVSDKELALLYEWAEILLFASCYEGFGFPLLEAMHTGTAIVTSNNSAMRELGTEAAYLVDPFDEEAIAAGIIDCVQNVTQTETFVRTGRERVKTFTWEQCGKAHALLYERLAASFSKQ